MKAAHWHAAKDIRVEDIDEPQVTPGDIKIKVA
jgi:(R,R)-butanediol dehydrogenase/meso-butanediol dehydrogenase/diacetyl reductase